MTVYAAYFEWRDNAGSFYRQKLYTNADGAPVDGLAAELQNLSNAGLQQHSAGELIVDANPAINAQFPTIAQVAVLIYLCADGSTVRIQVPAPLDTIFLPDGLRVDPTQVAALSSLLTSYGTSVLGSPVTALDTGTLVNRKADVP